MRKHLGLANGKLRAGTACMMHMASDIGKHHYHRAPADEKPTHPTLKINSSAAGAAIGEGLVMVRSRPRISIVTTGDEVRPIDDPLDRPEDAVRIRNSNGSLLASLLTDRTTFGAVLSPPTHAADDVVRIPY